MDGEFRYYPVSSPAITFLLDEMVKIRMTLSKPTVIINENGVMSFEDRWVTQEAEDAYKKLLELLHYEQQLFHKQFKGFGYFTTAT